MAETAAILSPDKKVLIPDINAGCPMADMITREGLRALKARHPGALVVAYVNTPAEVKAETDFCCTSGNAVEVIVHPECTLQVITLADRAFSTSGMCRYTKNSSAKEIIIGTETGFLYKLRKESPDKVFYAASKLAICPNMKLINLEKILLALEDMRLRFLKKCASRQRWLLTG